MVKKEYCTIRVRPETKKKLEEIAQKTRYRQGEILDKLVLATRIDEKMSQFYTDVSSNPRIHLTEKLGK